MAYEPQNYSHWTSNMLGKITLSYSYNLGKITFYYIFLFLISSLISSLSFYWVVCLKVLNDIIKNK